MVWMIIFAHLFCTQGDFLLLEETNKKHASILLSFSLLLALHASISKLYVAVCAFYSSLTHMMSVSMPSASQASFYLQATKLTHCPVKLPSVP